MSNPRWESWKAANPAQAAELEEHWADRDAAIATLRAEGASAEDISTVWNAAKADELEISRRYRDTESTIEEDC